MTMEVPYSGAPQVSPELRPRGSISGAAPAQAFGAASAEATQRLGAEVARTGDEIFARAIALQQLDQQAEASNAYSEFVKQQGVKFANYETLQGKEAVDSYKPFIDDLSSAREEFSGKLNSDYARKIFDNESRSFLAHTTMSAARHSATQNKNYLIGTSQSTVDAAVDAAGANPTSEDLYLSSLGKVDSQRAQMQTLRGWSPEQADEWSLSEKSKVVAARVESLARTNPAAAQKVLNQAQKDGIVSSDIAGKAGQFIRNQRIAVTSRVESAEFLAGKGFAFGSGKVSGERLLDAIASNESGGNYAARGPEVVSGDFKGQRALGKYQIMPGNLQPWLKEAGMPSMSEVEFLNNHKAQDDLAKFKLLQYQEKHGSANEAARHWRGLADVDPTVNETAATYLKKFNAALGRTAKTADVESLAGDRAKSIIPDDDEFNQVFVDKVRTEHNRVLQQEKVENFERVQSVAEAINTVGSGGRLVTSLDQLSPDAQEQYNQLKPTDQIKFRNALWKNAEGGYAPTPENTAAFQRWMGLLINPQISDDDRQKALDQDFGTMEMPAKYRLALMKEQRRVMAKEGGNPQVGHAMQVLGPMLNQADVTKDDRDQFRGILQEILLTQFEGGKKRPNDAEILEIGRGLLRQVVTSRGWLWDSRGPAFQMEVPEQVRTKIIDTYKSSHQGSDPSDEEVQRVYTTIQFNNYFAKQKPESAK